MFIWKPTLNKIFSMTLKREVTIIKGSQHMWMDWVWPKLLPNKVSICVWKSLFNYLPFYERVRRLSIPLASGCDCCVDHKEETLNQILSTRSVACIVWKKATFVLGIFNVEEEPWRVKIC